jgi:hypothetical protein
MPKVGPNPFSPAAMAPQERLSELFAILAMGLVRAQDRAAQRAKLEACRAAGDGAPRHAP